MRAESTLQPLRLSYPSITKRMQETKVLYLTSFPATGSVVFDRTHPPFLPLPSLFLYSPFFPHTPPHPHTPHTSHPYNTTPERVGHLRLHRASQARRGLLYAHGGRRGDCKIDNRKGKEGGKGGRMGLGGPGLADRVCIGNRGVRIRSGGKGMKGRMKGRTGFWILRLEYRWQWWGNVRGVCVCRQFSSGLRGARTSTENSAAHGPRNHHSSSTGDSPSSCSVQDQFSVRL